MGGRQDKSVKHKSRQSNMPSYMRMLYRPCAIIPGDGQGGAVMTRTEPSRGSEAERAEVSARYTRAVWEDVAA